jgi:hypothetical protein
LRPTQTIGTDIGDARPFEICKTRKLFQDFEGTLEFESLLFISMCVPEMTPATPVDVFTFGRITHGRRFQDLTYPTKYPTPNRQLAIQDVNPNVFARQRRGNRQPTIVKSDETFPLKAITRDRYLDSTRIYRVL